MRANVTGDLEKNNRHIRMGGRDKIERDILMALGPL